MDILLKETREALAIARGQIGVLRGLLAEALGVIETIDDGESDDWMLIMALKAKMQAAIEGTLP